MIKKHLAERIYSFLKRLCSNKRRYTMAFLKYLFLVVSGLTCLECTKLTATDNPNFIQTPGYNFGNSYSSNMYVTWIIETEDSYSVIEVEIEMDIQDTYNCYNDYLQVFDGGSSSEGESLGRFCGTHSAMSVTSSGRKMYVVFKSDGWTEGKGFKLVYKQVGKVDAWMVVGIVLAVSITILVFAFVLFRCGVCKSKDQVSSIRPYNDQHQPPVWMSPRQQNHVQLVPVQVVPPPTYRDGYFQNPQHMEMREMNQGIVPGTPDNVLVKP